jgi:hypothetical protein
VAFLWLPFSPLTLLERVPDDTWELAILGWDYEQKGMHEQAIAEKAVELTNKDSPLFSPFYLAGLAHAYAVAGRRSDAETVLQGLLERARRSYVSPFDIALIYSALGIGLLLWFARHQSLLEPGSRHCYGIITLIDKSRRPVTIHKGASQAPNRGCP